MSVTVKAAAKINLLLDLTSVLENGYHSIYTCMQSVSLFDVVTVDKNPSNKITLNANIDTIPLNEKNTAYMAAVEFFKFTGIDQQGVDIFIEKNIPFGAGLAGGSADAAATIKCMDILFETGLKKSDLLSICKRVGADVPFCFVGGTQLCLNIGDIMARVPDLPQCRFLIVKPEQSVKTVQAYADFDSSEWIRHPDNDGFLYALTNGDLYTMCQKAANVFEQVVEISDRVKIKSIMRNHSAKLALMSGSGASVFGLFTDNKIDECQAELSKIYDNVYNVEPTHQSLFLV